MLAVHMAKLKIIHVRLKKYCGRNQQSTEDTHLLCSVSHDVLNNSDVCIGLHVEPIDSVLQCTQSVAAAESYIGNVKVVLRMSLYSIFKVDPLEEVPG